MTEAFNRIGVIGAMDEEIELFLHGFEQITTTEKAGIVFYEGLFSTKKTILCKSGVGKVNAAICTQILIDFFRADAVLFSGVAGALHPSLEIGDLVISTDCLQHDMDVTALGFAKGIIPYEEHSIFPADPGLIEMAYKSCTRLLPKTALKGRILSGDQFIANRDMVRSLYEDMEGVCTEMEGAAVAQVCFKNHIPFVVIRSMSDKADGSAHVNFAEFTPLAARHSYLIIEDMIRNMV